MIFHWAPTPMRDVGLVAMPLPLRCWNSPARVSRPPTSQLTPTATDGSTLSGFTSCSTESRAAAPSADVLTHGLVVCVLVLPEKRIAVTCVKRSPLCHLKVFTTSRSAMPTRNGPPSHATPRSSPMPLPFIGNSLFLPLPPVSLATVRNFTFTSTGDAKMSEPASAATASTCPIVYLPVTPIAKCCSSQLPMRTLSGMPQLTAAVESSEPSTRAPRNW